MKITFFLRLVIISLLSSGFVIGLYLVSNHSIHQNNPFIRSYPHHPITRNFELNIQYNSYYIAGYVNDKLYLGNTTAPLHLIEVNLKTKDTTHITIKIDQTDLPFRSVRVKLSSPHFFVMDGYVPAIFRGTIGNWEARLWMKEKFHFSNAIPIDTNKVFISSNATRQTVLGYIEKNKNFNIHLDSHLLEPQIDSVFSVDGTMIISQDQKYLGYVYYYRNQYTIMDSQLDILTKNSTIDTLQTANIELSTFSNGGITTLKNRPTVVNLSAALFKNLILINTTRLGKNDEAKMLDQASIVDVYNWQNQTYEFSFYLYNKGKKHAREFAVYDNYLVALVDNELDVYNIETNRFR
ncbi:hypothetical protein MWU59_08730 [Flavobacteriaceae bacterium F08102]|nr:hypothetical protein [Flavobacteriaceae bacterium F08102]